MVLKLKQIMASWPPKLQSACRWMWLRCRPVLTVVRQSYQKSPGTTVALVVIAVAGLSWTVGQGVAALLQHASTKTAEEKQPMKPTQYIERQGTKLVLEGQPFRFTGINVYNASSLYSCSVPLGSGSQLDDIMDAWPSTGHTVMRTWFYQKLATKPDGSRDWSGFDHTLAVAKQHGVHVIATLGDQWGDCDDNRYKTGEWYDRGYRNPSGDDKQAYRQWAAEVTARYRDDPTIMAWQLMNEAETSTARNGGCTPNGAAILRAFADDVGGLVKATDPNHLVSLGTIGSGQCGSSGADYITVHSSPHIDLCEYHDYSATETMPGDQWNGLALRLRQCRGLDKPLFIGETGIRVADAGGTLESRAEAFRRKLTASFAGGAVGELVWAWQSTDGYGITFGDPVLEVLADLPALLQK